MTLAAIPLKPTRNPNDVLAPGVVRVLHDDGTVDPAHDPGLTDAELIGLYRALVRVRMLDERLVALQRQGRIGFHIGSLGEEAAILGSAFAMRPSDWIFPCYREFGAALWRGLPLQRYVDNMFGNENDPVRGRQMPDHYTCRAAKFGSVSSPIGTQITQAVGFAWAAKLKKDDLVTLVYFGDGATSSNEFHCGMNFAGVFRTPTVLFCRNNGWAISVPTERQTASATFADKGIAYGVHAVRCDGNDLLAVIATTRDAVARAAPVPSSGARAGPLGGDHERVRQHFSEPLARSSPGSPAPRRGARLHARHEPHRVPRGLLRADGAARAARDRRDGRDRGGQRRQRCARA